jgi:hypothetical protein
MTALAFTQQVTFLYVRDLAASERFYGDTLGLELVLNQGLARIYRIGQGNAFLGICLSSTVQQAPPPDRAPLGVIVTFVTDDVDGAYAELGARASPSRRRLRLTRPTTSITASSEIPTAICWRSRSSFRQTGRIADAAPCVTSATRSTMRARLPRRSTFDRPALRAAA